MRVNSARVTTSERDTTPNRRPSIMIPNRARKASGTATSAITISRPSTGERVSAAGYEGGDQGGENRDDDHHN
jgi:hypothetical protein